MEEKYEVIGSKGDVYIVTIGNEGSLYARCTCQAGQKNVLCHHILDKFAELPELNEELRKQDFYVYYDEYVKKTEEIDKLKKEAAAAKKTFAKHFLKK